jgi:hypothetical protein
MSTFLQERLTGCGRSLTIYLIAVLIAVPLVCLLVFVPLLLVGRFDLSPWYLIIPAGLFLLILWGGAPAVIVLVLYRRARHLDTVFTPLGLTGRVYQLFFRQYRGATEGRQVDVCLYRGPSVEMDISTPLQTRLGVTGQHADTLALSRLLGREPLPLADPTLDGLTVFALDETWTRTLLAQPEVPDLLRRLIAFEGSFTRRHVLLRPGWLRLHLFGSRRWLDFTFDIAPEQARLWLDDLLALARIAESLPAPQVTAEASSAERFAQSLRSRNPYLVPAIVFGVFLVTLLCALAIGAVVFVWATTQ